MIDWFIIHDDIRHGLNSGGNKQFPFEKSVSGAKLYKICHTFFLAALSSSRSVNVGPLVRWSVGRSDTFVKK